jgi:hypothetical protein
MLPSSFVLPSPIIHVSQEEKPNKFFFFSRKFKPRSTKGKEIHPCRGSYCLPEHPVEMRREHQTYDE